MRPVFRTEKPLVPKFRRNGRQGDLFMPVRRRTGNSKRLVVLRVGYQIAAACYLQQLLQTFLVAFFFLATFFLATFFTAFLATFFLATFFFLATAFPPLKGLGETLADRFDTSQSNESHHSFVRTTTPTCSISLEKINTIVSDWTRLFQKKNSEQQNHRPMSGSSTTSDNA
jgi:hypothetical protein